MKVAVVTDDLKTISPHFGRAQHYLVYDIEADVIRGREVRDKMGHGPDAEERLHHRDAGPEMTAIHGTMLSAVRDCEVIISRGMGGPMYESIVEAGMKGFVTRLQLADDAVKALIAGTLDNRLETLH